MKRDVTTTSPPRRWNDLRTTTVRKRFYTTEEACEYLNISRLTLWRWRRDGLIRARLTPTGKLRYDIQQVRALVAEEPTVAALST
jgi:excisionase family DNA binding protein